MRGCCDPGGGASDGSRVAIYQTPFSECLSLRCARAVCMRHASAFIYGYGKNEADINWSTEVLPE